MNEINNTAILNVKNSISGEWIEIPAITGTSVYTLPAIPTSREIISQGNTIV